MGLLRRNKERTENLKRKAYEMGMDFYEKEPFDIKPLLQDFSLFRRGYAKRVTNVLRKKEELNTSDLRVFDYRYTIGAGNNSRTFRQSVFFLQTKQLALPHFWMKPETFFNRIGDYLGFQKDIDFKAYPEFSDNYLLQGEDEELVRYIMNHGLLRFFSLEKGWYLEGINYYLILYQHNVLFSPNDLEVFSKIGLELYEMLKASSDDL